MKFSEKIGLICALLSCLMLICLGVGVWFSSYIWIAKFVLSFICIIPGIAMGVIAIDLWRDE